LGCVAIIYLQTDFYYVAMKLLRIMTKAFMTFPEYVWAKNAE